MEQDDIRRTFAAIRDGKTAVRVKTGPRGLARVTGGEGAARYACRLLRAAFSWAVAERLIERNPTIGVDLGSDGEREIVLDGRHYARLFAMLGTMESQRRIRPAVAAAIGIIAMTGARRGEITGLRWRARGSEKRPPRPASWSAQDRSQDRQAARDPLPAAAQQIVAASPRADRTTSYLQHRRARGRSR